MLRWVGSLTKLVASVDDAGQIQLSGNFFDDFASGRLGGKLQSVLKSYGEEHIDNLFGKQTYRALTGLADDMTRASNQAIAGKGGLAAPQIALSLGLFSIITNPSGNAAGCNWLRGDVKDAP
jgi:hypothetical protein